MYNIREFCEIYSAPQGKIKSPADEDKTQDTFISVRYIAGQDSIDLEEEVILKKEFMEYVLEDLELLVYVNDPTQTAKLEEMFKRIGANGIFGNSLNVIKFEVLISAMRVLKYAYAGQVLNLKIKSLDFRMLNARSIRIMNRFAEIITLYQ